MWSFASIRNHFTLTQVKEAARQRVPNMDRTTAQEKGIVEPEHLEIIQNNATQLQPTHYRPQNDAERRLDKKVNLKLDLIVVALLAVEFIVSALSSSRPNHSSISLTNTVLRNRQDQRWFCRNQLVRQRR